MKKNLTELVFIIDKSGSMAGLEADTIGGINTTLDDNRKEEGEALVSLVFFDNTSKVIIDRRPIDEVAPLKPADYRPGGCTALLDAVGDAISYHHRAQKILPKPYRAEHVIFVIITDGMENASTHRTYDEVSKKIKKARSRGWEFLFLGANIDVSAEAARMGIDESRASRYVSDSEGSRAVYEAVSIATRQTRRCGAPSADWAAAPMADARRRG